MLDERDPTRPMRAQAPIEVARPGDRIGAWIVGQRLGGGGFGEVYEVAHHVTGQRAALKRLHAHFMSAPEMVARFEREVSVLARLRHPNVVEIVDAGVDASGRPFLCMELLFGRDLGSLASKRLEPDAVRAILDPLCDAIATAHDLGIIHRDLKASNVFLCDGDGRVVLLDFGIAKISDALAPELTASHESLGTVGCMAPEQIHGHGIDARTDVYALGGLLFELVTGQRPFLDPSETMSQYLHLHARRPRASALVPVSTALDDVIVRAMAIEPNQRFADVRAFAAAAGHALRESRARGAPREHAAILVTIGDRTQGTELDEPLLADLEAVLPEAERALSEHGFALALDLGTTAIFLAPLIAFETAASAAAVTWARLAARPGRDSRVRVGIAVHRGVATVTGDRVEPCELLRPETWGIPDPLDGVWSSSAMTSPATCSSLQ